MWKTRKETQKPPSFEPGMHQVRLDTAQETHYGRIAFLCASRYHAGSHAGGELTSLSPLRLGYPSSSILTTSTGRGYLTLGSSPDHFVYLYMGTKDGQPTTAKTQNKTANETPKTMDNRL